MEKEFNLRKEREELFELHQNVIPYAFMLLIKNQDKEFIKQLKEFAKDRNRNLIENQNNPRMNWQNIATTELSNICFKIDNLAGEDL